MPKAAENTLAVGEKKAVAFAGWGLCADEEMLSEELGARGSELSGVVLASDSAAIPCSVRSMPTESPAKEPLQSSQ